MQVALALVLLVGSGLMIRTFQALLNVEPGFATTAIVQTARVWVPPPQVPDPERVTRMQHEILDKIAALPGVTAAAFASAVPMEGPIRVWTQPVYVDGQTRRTRDDAAACVESRWCRPATSTRSVRA